MRGPDAADPEVVAAEPAPVDVVLIGAGLRGMISYGMNAAAAGIRFVGVVERSPSRRSAFAEVHRIPASARFASVDEWLAAPQVATAVLIATPDDQHFGPAVAALRAGYDVVVEKPMAQSAQECRTMVEVAEDHGRALHVCHVLRYTPFFQAVRHVVQSGRLGRIVTVEHRENVESLHMAHSYVRGAYGRTDRANPMLLAKSCHDMDMLLWILDEPVRSVSSFGSLTHFRRDAVGPEIPARCSDGCPIQETCIYDAAVNYAPEVTEFRPGIRGLTQLFPLSDPMTLDRDERLAALRTSDFGRCVYRCDNDVVDHQVVAMEMRSGTTVAFTMHGHSHEEGRTMRYDGTRATLRATFTDEPEITVIDHGSREVERIDIGEFELLGHGGGDVGLMRALAASLRGDDGALTSDARSALRSHEVAWAAERSRLTRSVVEPAVS
jgi:predicted dehydrogenase